MQPQSQSKEQPMEQPANQQRSQLPSQPANQQQDQLPSKPTNGSAKPPLKQRVYASLEDPLHARPFGKALGIALIVLIVANALLVGVPDRDLDGHLRTLFVGFGIFSTLVFALEYACRIWIADLVYPHLAPARARVRYIFSLMGIVDFLSFFPALFLFFLPASTAINDAIRIIRLVRLIKISRYMRGLRSIGRVFVKRRQEIIAAFMVLALLAIASSVLMYEAEHTAQPEVFDSVWTGLYWAITTMTTTGYGDIVPITPLGRLIGFVVMVISIGVVAIPAGIFSAGFIEEFRSQQGGALEKEAVSPANASEQQAPSSFDSPSESTEDAR